MTSDTMTRPASRTSKADPIAKSPAGASARRRETNLDAPIVPSRKAPPRSLLRGVDRHLVSLVAPDSPEAEQYRTLRYAVEYEHRAGEGSLVGVCSPVPGDGKSITSINLAGALAQDSQAKVLLVEADLRRPSVTLENHLALGKATGPGLVDAIQDLSYSLDDVVQHLPHFNLSVLAAGKRSNAPYEALNSARFGEILMQARRRYDYVVVDTPPVVPVPDCRLIAKWVPRFIMVVAAGRTPREAVDDAIALLGQERLLGLVFNGYDRTTTPYYGYGYDDLTRRRRRHW